MSKTITLEKLVLTNYRNIEHQELVFTGNSKIVGENRIGKTNILESIHYLLTDKLLNNDSDITRIKPLSDTKKMVTVEGTFDVDGTKLELKKVYGENWVKVRNTQEVVFKGHETTYYINSIKQGTLKEYNQQIEEKFGFKNDINKIDLFQLLINPFYIGEMGDSKDWTALREFVIKLVGDITDEDIFNAKPETLPIKEDLKQASGKIEQIRKLYKSQSDGLKANVQSFESQIEMLEKTEKPNDDTIDVAKKAIEEIETNIANLRSKNGADLLSASIKEKIANKKTEISDAKLEEVKFSRNPALDTAQKELDDLIQEHQDLLLKSSKKAGEINIADTKVKNLEHEIKICEEIKRHTIEEYNRLKSQRENPNIATECPTCHRKYESEDIENALAAYVLGINTKIEEVTNKGKENKAYRVQQESELEKAKQELVSLQKERDDIKQEIEDLTSKIASKREELANLPRTIGGMTSTRVPKLEEELKALEDELVKATNDYNAGIKDTSEAIAREQEKLPKYKKVLDDKAYYDRQMKVLEETKANMKKANNDLIAVEQKKDLVNLFAKTKLIMLDQNISKVFGNIKFQLLSENINGGYDTVCKPYIYDVSKDVSSDVIWKSGSKSEMVATGIAIAEKIKEALRLPNLPYLFDEGGEISTDTFVTRFKTQAQIICVKVQDDIQKPLVMAI